jgi:hypothetical protein
VEKFKKIILEELEQLEQTSLERAKECSSAVGLAVNSSIEQTRLGGGVVNQLLGRDRSTFERETAEKTERVGNSDQRALLVFLAKAATQTRGNSESVALRNLMSLAARRQDLLRRVRRDVQLQGLLQLWLYVHIPLSVAVMFALIIHIVVVFWYW